MSLLFYLKLKPLRRTNTSLWNKTFWFHQEHQSEHTSVHLQSRTKITSKDSNKSSTQNNEATLSTTNLENDKHLQTISSTGKLSPVQYRQDNQTSESALINISQEGWEKQLLSKLKSYKALSDAKRKNTSSIVTIQKQELNKNLYLQSFKSFVGDSSQMTSRPITDLGERQSTKALTVLEHKPLSRFPNSDTPKIHKADMDFVKHLTIYLSTDLLEGNQVSSIDVKHNIRSNRSIKKEQHKNNPLEAQNRLENAKHNELIWRIQRQGVESSRNDGFSLALSCAFGKRSLSSTSFILKSENKLPHEAKEIVKVFEGRASPSVPSIAGQTKIEFNFTLINALQKAISQRNISHDPEPSRSYSIARFLLMNVDWRKRFTEMPLLRDSNRQSIRALHRSSIPRERAQLNQKMYLCPSSVLQSQFKASKTEYIDNNLAESNQKRVSSPILLLCESTRRQQGRAALPHYLTLAPSHPNINFRTSLNRQFSSANNGREFRLSQQEDFLLRVQKEIKYIICSHVPKPPRSIQHLLSNESFKTEVEAARQRFRRIKKSGVKVDVESVIKLSPFGQSIITLIKTVANSTDEIIAKQLLKVQSQLQTQRREEASVEEPDLVEMNSKLIFNKLKSMSFSQDDSPHLSHHTHFQSNPTTRHDLTTVCSKSQRSQEPTFTAGLKYKQHKVGVAMRAENKIMDDKNSEEVTEGLDDAIMFRSQLTKRTIKPIDLSSRNMTFSNSRQKDFELLVRQGALLDRNRITVGSFSEHLKVNETQVSELVQLLLDENVTSETPLTVDEAEFVAGELGVQDKLMLSALEDKTLAKQKLVSRPPIIAVVGHVDHGKTTLLDTLRKTCMVSEEVGKITQCVRAFEVRTYLSKSSLTFIDTPGHETFQTMRKRGVRIADAAVLVIAADEGIKPQTLETYMAAKAVRVPLIIAINKIDKPNADVARTTQEIHSQLSLTPEEKIVAISAKTGKNMNSLEEALVCLTNRLNLTADVETPKATAFILEARSSVGSHSGITYSCIMQGGQLKVGGLVFIAQQAGKIIRFFSFKDNKLLPFNGSPLPSQPFEVAVRFSQNSKALLNVESKPSGVGDLLVQISSFKEWRKLQRYYESRAAAVANKLSLKETSAAGIQQRAEYIKSMSDRLNRTNFIKKIDKAQWLRHQAGKLDSTVKAHRESLVGPDLLPFERFLALSHYPQLHISLATKDDGVMSALIEWVNEFNDKKKAAFEAKEFPKLSEEIKTSGKSLWKRRSEFDPLDVPLPINISMTTLGFPSESQIEQMKDLGQVLFVFGLEDGELAQRLTRDSKLKYRHHNIIYNVFKDIGVLYEYQFGPTIRRSSCAKSGPVSGVSKITLNGKKCTVAEVTLSSGLIEANHCVIDIKRNSKMEAEGQCKNNSKIESSVNNGSETEMLVASSVPIESLAVRGKPCSNAKAPICIDFAVDGKLANLRKGDLIEWFQTQKVKPPFNDTKFQCENDEK